MRVLDMLALEPLDEEREVIRVSTLRLKILLIMWQQNRRILILFRVWGSIFAF
jgi:hypothetical protein